MTMQQQVLPLTGIMAPDTGHYRGDHLLAAGMVERGSKVLDVGCGDGDLLQLLENRGIDGRGIELSRRRGNRAWCWRICCGSDGVRSCRSRISGSGKCGCNS